MARRLLLAVPAGALVAPALALALVLVGCGHDDAGSRSGPGVSAAEIRLHVVATVHVGGAGTVVPAAHRLWVVSGDTGEVTQVDPSTGSVTKVVSLPHPAAYGALAHGSLWLASMHDSALMEVDAASGTVLRTLERTPARPLDLPAGIAAAGDDLWVMGHDDGTLLRVDARTGTVTRMLSLAGHKAGGPVLAGGSLWVTMTKEGIVYQVDPATGRVVDPPVRVDTGLCVSSSVVGDAIWFTSDEDPTGVFRCSNGASRLDATSREVSPLASGEGRSLYSFARYDGSLWATDTTRRVYRVDEHSGVLRVAMTLPGRPDSNRLFTAFGSLWMTRSGTGELLRLEAA